MTPVLAPRPRALALVAVVIAGIAGSGCAVVPDDAQPKVHYGAEVADKYIHRGMPQNRRGVLQGTMDTTLPTRWGDAIAIGAFANMDLHSTTGSAWFPDGHGGRVTEFDLTATYAHEFESGIDIAGGIHNYNFPYGESFPNGPREQTNELFVHVAGDFLGARPELQARFDVDQAEGSYWRFAISEDFPIDEEFKVVLLGHVGWSSESQSLWNYGIEESGLADLQVGVKVLYAYDAHTTIGASLNGSTILDSGISDWFDLIGIDSDNYWVSVFVDWSF